MSGLPQQEVMSLTAASQARRQEHGAVQEQLEIQSVAATVVVPTLPGQVRGALRAYGQPVRVFGENLANVRDRLRILLATLQVRGIVKADDGSLVTIKQEGSAPQQQQQVTEYDDTEEEVTKYTRGEIELLQARQKIAEFSLRRAAQRLAREAKLREGARSVRKRKKDPTPPDEKEQNDNVDEWKAVQRDGFHIHQRVKDLVLEASQYADSRSLAAVCAVRYNNHRLVASAGWTSSVKFWDASSLSEQGEQILCHEDRIMGMSAMQTATTAPFFCTASLDKTAKLWTLQEHMVTGGTDDDDDDDDNTSDTVTFSLQEKAHFQGHEARLCRTAFHPMQQHVATTSFDHTWRFWNIETAQCLLLQDGHWKQVFGIDFHPDGSLVATTDLASVVQLWDLRTGRAVHHFLGHAKRVLCANFSQNGFHLATAGDDGFIKVWDLRRRKPVVSIPAHSNLIAQVKFESSTSDTLVSASFDGTAKVWSARDWKLLNTLHGHDGKVSGIDFVANHGLVTCGYDRTIKTWQ